MIRQVTISILLMVAALLVTSTSITSAPIQGLAKRVLIDQVPRVAWST